MRLLGKYFQVHKKLAIPLSGIFSSSSSSSKSRLYKAQSCGSLVRDKITSLNPDSGSGVLTCRQRAVSVLRDGGDINDNNKQSRRKSSASTVVQLNNVCNELTGICAVHLGHASKCCSFCWPHYFFFCWMIMCAWFLIGIVMKPKVSRINFREVSSNC